MLYVLAVCTLFHNSAANFCNPSQGPFASLAACRSFYSDDMGHAAPYGFHGYDRLFWQCYGRRVHEWRPE